MFDRRKSLSRHSHQDILLLIARRRASPNVLISELHFQTASCKCVGALNCALWQLGSMIQCRR
ncbi:hypothetical protein F6476_03465 [Pseudomonas umsongensis]|nr:hypothetical protein F6476_03465 [Pseudomonas umsongensis]